MKVRPFLAGLALAVVAAAGPAAALRNDYGVNVVNETEAPIQAVHFSSCKDPNWGPDRLDATEVIPPKASRFFDMHDGIADCCRDLLVRFANGAARQRKGLNVCEVYEWVVK
jgi:hypothetical protein